MVEQMMIEQWKTSASFDLYFATCAPTQCTYSDTTHTKDSVGIVITLVSTVSGLTAALRLIVPLLVRFAFHLLQPRNRKKPESKRARHSH